MASPSWAVRGVLEVTFITSIVPLKFYMQYTNKSKGTSGAACLSASGAPSCIVVIPHLPD